MVRTVALLAAGGAGTRLYPASAPDRPKQFLSLGGERSLLRRTADRAAFADAMYAVTRERYADRVAEIVPEATVLTDPGLDTGPAFVAATHEIREREREREHEQGRDPDTDDEPLVVCVLPTDHRVAGEFASAMERAAAAAADTGGLVCLGVDPDRPATGYGYVEPAVEPEAGEAVEPGEGECVAVEQFREKPDADTAATLIDAGCLWNAGIFAWTPGAFLDAAATSPLAPLVDALDAGDPAAGFDAVPEISVDYAVLERTDDAYVVPATFEWDDLGTWDAVGRSLERDRDAPVVDGGDPVGPERGEALDGGIAGNAVFGDALAVDASENVIVGEDAHVSVVGVDGLAVVACDDRVLVVSREDADRVREVVAALRETGAYPQ